MRVGDVDGGQTSGLLFEGQEGEVAQHFDAVALGELGPHQAIESAKLTGPSDVEGPEATAFVPKSHV